MSTTPEDVTIEVHQTPPDNWTGPSENIGHLKATGKGVSVTLPVSLALLDDLPAVDWYIKSRLLKFHQIEVERREVGRDQQTET